MHYYNLFTKLCALWFAAICAMIDYRKKHVLTPDVVCGCYVLRHRLHNPYRSRGCVKKTFSFCLIYLEYQIERLYSVLTEWIKSCQLANWQQTLCIHGRRGPYSILQCGLFSCHNLWKRHKASIVSGVLSHKTYQLNSWGICVKLHEDLGIMAEFLQCCHTNFWLILLLCPTVCCIVKCFG